MIEITEGLFKILDFIETAYDFLISFIQSLFKIIKILPSALASLMTFMGLIPGAAYVFMAALISVSIVYVILGRNH